MIKKALIILSFCCLNILATHTLYADEMWSLEECLEYGLQNHPILQAARQNLEAEFTKEHQTYSTFDPRLDARASISGSRALHSDSRPITGGINESRSESISFSKTLYDSGITELQLKAAKESVSASQAKLSFSESDLASSIKKAYFIAQQSMELYKVRIESLDRYQKHLERVEAYVEVGTRPPYDITRAKVDVANAEVELITAKSRIELALSSLAKAIGYNGKIRINEFDPDLLYEARLTDESEQIEQEVLKRGDLLSAQHQINSAQIKIEEAKRSLKPRLSASANYQWSGISTPYDRSWGFGLSVSWPLYEGRITSSKIKLAKIQSEVAKATLNNLQLSVNNELQNALIGIEDAIKRHGATVLLVKQAAESLELAEGRYESGVGSPIEIADARAEYTRAQGNHIVAFFDILIAETELDRVLGHLPPEIQITELSDEELERLNSNEKQKNLH